MSSKRDCILAFFGCFSPPTNGHINAMTCAYDHMNNQNYNVKSVIFIPASGGYESRKPGLIDAQFRLTMCRMIADEYDFIDVDSVEADKTEWTRTIDTLQYLSNKYPNTRILLVCGIDTVDVFETQWREPDIIRILNEFGLIVLPRNGVHITNIESHCKYLIGRTENVYVVESNPLSEVSSSLVRERLSNKNHISGLVLKSVEDYIYRNHLYDT